MNKLTSNSQRAEGSATTATGSHRGDRQVRLSLSLSPKVADVLKGYAERHEISITEAVRRAVSVLDFVEEVQEKNETIGVSRGNSIREVEFRW